MLRFGFVAVLGAVTFLISSTQTDAAVGVVAFVADSVLERSVVEPVHYRRRHGWHCEMRSYNHEHRKTFQRMREGVYWDDSSRTRYESFRRRSFGAGAPG
jgi:hypothetical protein